MWKSFFYLLTLYVLASPEFAHAGSCKVKSDNTLYLKGSTDTEMLDCVRKADLTNIDTVLLKSRGGPVGPAMNIGDMIAPLNAHMIVKDYCNSSCANYFLPVASSVTVEAEAEVLLHGSIDEGGAKKYNYDGTWERFYQQQAYALKHKIHRGWLMYRHDYNQGGGNRFIYVDGELGWEAELSRKAGVLVEEKFFSSCFVNIPIKMEEPTLIQQALSNIKFKTKLLEQGFQPSGHWTCKGPFDPNWPVPSVDVSVKGPQPN